MIQIEALDEQWAREPPIDVLFWKWAGFTREPQPKGPSAPPAAPPPAPGPPTQGAPAQRTANDLALDAFVRMFAAAGGTVEQK